MDVDHGLVAKIFEKEMNSLLRGKEERQPWNLFGNFVSNFFAMKDSFKKDDVQQQELLEKPSPLIMKNNLLVQFVENM